MQRPCLVGFAKRGARSRLLQASSVPRNKIVPMRAKAITPILNVSDIAASFAWFEKWDWKKLWDWATPPTFGAVGSGACEIFLCQGVQGGRGRGANAATFGPHGDETADKG